MAPSHILYKSQIIPITAFVLGTLLFSTLLWYYSSNLFCSLLDAVSGMCLLAITGFFLSFFLRNYLPAKNELMMALGYLAILSVMFHFVQTGFLLHSNLFDASYLAFVDRGNFVRWAFVALLISFFLAFNWYRSAGISREKEIEIAHDIQGLAREAELNKLQQQIQPHFLFNSLNSINSLLGSRPEEARNMVQKLSAFFRGTLSNSGNEGKSLEQELQHLKLCLGIEELRFGHRLKVDFQVDEDCLQVEIPFLLLQPVMENAIKFGLYGTTGDVRIHLKAGMKAKMMHISIANPVGDETASSADLGGTGFGLTAMHRRLYLLYGRKDLLKTELKDSIFTTFISIPVNT